MSFAPEGPSESVPGTSNTTVLLRLEALVAKLSHNAAAAPGRLLTGPALAEAVSTLSAASALFENHRLVTNAPTVASPAQPAKDLLLAAELLQAAVRETLVRDADAG